MERAAAREEAELREDLWKLTMVTAVVPLLGIGTTLLWVLDSFGGMTGSKEAIALALADRLGNALVPAAFGISSGLFALWAQHLAMARVAVFRLEMRSMAARLAHALRCSSDCDGNTGEMPGDWQRSSSLETSRRAKFWAGGILGFSWAWQAIHGFYWLGDSMLGPVAGALVSTLAAFLLVALAVRVFPSRWREGSPDLFLAAETVIAALFLLTGPLMG